MLDLILGKALLSFVWSSLFFEDGNLRLLLAQTLKRGMQDVFLFHKNACAFQQGLFIGDEKLDCPQDKEEKP